MRKEKKLEYTFLIICEGNNTEPLFFGSIRDKIMDGIYKIDSFEKDEIIITIRREPKDESNDDAKGAKPSPHKAKRNNRKLKKVAEETEGKNAPHPLNFIEEGQIELSDGTYNEVWAVFDHDNHPAREQAFEQSEKLISGNKINIAFSSIAFEYYLLIHFERIFKAFNSSECREGNERNKQLYNCGTGVHMNDCNGDNCIGGYARIKGYWKTSKKLKSTFPLIENKLEIGFINSAWLRFQSFNKNGTLPIYDRNPYITTDSLVKRLTGFNEFNYEWFNINTSTKIDNINIKVVANRITISNSTNNNIVIPDNFLTIYNDNSGALSWGNRIHLTPMKEVEIEIPATILQNSSYIIFQFNNHKKIYSL